MDLNAFIADHAPTWTEWRHDLHAHPELAFAEHRTSAFVADQLTKFGIEVYRGYAETGVVGVLKNGDGPRIGLRADMDALPILEQTNLAYQSTNAGVMHACGHDGHTVMLLAAAQTLAVSKSFRGTIIFIFQPAEEGHAGAQKMINAGLFKDHPVDQIYALHNWPGLDVGMFSARAGAQMAGFDTFDIVVNGAGGHAAMPHDCNDSIVAAGQLVTALQSIVSRTIDPQSSAVLSVTQIHAGDAYNVIPESVQLAGCTRYLDQEVAQTLHYRMGQICDGTAQQFGVDITLDYRPVYPPTINHPKNQQAALNAASTVKNVGEIYDDQNPSMASEDFAFMLQKVPGAYVWIGNGAVDAFGALHSARYNFNDAIIPYGVGFFASLAQNQLGQS